MLFQGQSLLVLPFVFVKADICHLGRSIHSAADSSEGKASLPKTKSNGLQQAHKHFSHGYQVIVPKPSSAISVMGERTSLFR
jgi:hypothetical protein